MSEEVCTVHACTPILLLNPAVCAQVNTENMQPVPFPKTFGSVPLLDRAYLWISHASMQTIMLQWPLINALLPEVLMTHWKANDDTSILMLSDCYPVLSFEVLGLALFMSEYILEEAQAQVPVLAPPRSTKPPNFFYFDSVLSALHGKNPKTIAKWISEEFPPTTTRGPLVLKHFAIKQKLDNGDSSALFHLVQGVISRYGLVITGRQVKWAMPYFAVTWNAWEAMGYTAHLARKYGFFAFKSTSPVWAVYMIRGKMTIQVIKYNKTAKLEAGMFCVFDGSYLYKIHPDWWVNEDYEKAEYLLFTGMPAKKL